MSNVGLSANSKNIKKFQLQQKGKNIVLVLVIVVPIFIAGVLYVIFQQYVSESRNTELVTDFDEFPSSSDISQPTDSGLDTPSYVPSTTDNQAFGSSQDSTGGLTTPNTGSVQPAPS
ncbi:hypothetical protein KC950_04725, partial [Candidatus Saccharibacteria bacterium]|nr:hypothetical protein [Candidatus Saccharibacteria bacterium]